MGNACCRGCWEFCCDTDSVQGDNIRLTPNATEVQTSQTVVNEPANKDRHGTGQFDTGGNGQGQLLIPIARTKIDGKFETCQAMVGSTANCFFDPRASPWRVKRNRKTSANDIHFTLKIPEQRIRRASMIEYTTTGNQFLHETTV